MKIITQKHKIADVFRYFVEGFTVGKGKQIVKHEANYDPEKGEVIFTLYIEQKETPPSASNHD